MNVLWRVIFILLIYKFAEGEFVADFSNDFINEESKLRDRLFYSGRHDTDVRPRLMMNHTVDVYLKFFPTYIEEVDEKKEIITLHGMMFFKWIDESLQWNPEDYKGINKINVADFLIWKPEVMLYNNAEANNIAVFSPSLAKINHTGRVHWVPPCVFRFICALDFTAFPFDKHNCTVKLLSWTHDSTLINLTSGPESQLPKNGLSLSEDKYHQEWEVYNTTITTIETFYDCCTESYKSIHINLIIGRRAPFYGYILLIPTIMIMLLILSVFWLPSTLRNEKLFLAGFNTICLVILLIFLHWIVPKSTGNVPSIVIFNGITIVLSIGTIVLSIITSRISLLEPPAPNILRPMFTGIATKIFCLGPSRTGIPIDAKLLTSGNVEINASEEDTHIDNSEKEEWVLVATVFDRIFFLFYCIAFIGILCVSFNTPT